MSECCHDHRIPRSLRRTWIQIIRGWWRGMTGTYARQLDDNIPAWLNDAWADSDLNR